MANFKARARALDMLGRQQIAGIPTAISELFKNAHDAYADNVVADYFESENLFVLRDDGIGMSEDDFTERWLVLGTESKVGAVAGVRPPRTDSLKVPRPILGEKGIGRLAIAVIGPQVLILTRPKPPSPEEESGEDGGSDTRLTAAFIHWGLFEIPGVNLDEVEVQIRTFDGGSLPTKTDLEKMVEATRQNVHRLRDSMSEEQSTQMLAELSQFDIDPQVLNARLRRPTVSDDGCGTQFFLKPAADSLLDNLRADTSDDQISDLTRTLIGFSNTMTPGHAPPRINTQFRHHKTNGSSVELISSGEFLTPEEFEDADHRIQGQFDEYGQFSGTLSIFDMEPRPIIVPWTGTRGKITDCGPFSISFAYVQGNRSETHLPPEEWARITKKLNRMGGLYIYRDGIRVLPYGNTDFDFLDIEKRRSKSASYYFFSYRRMFGAIDITHQLNANLSEKAGREGFRDNRAYTQFRSILINLLLQLAAEFFREEGAQTDIFRKRLAENSRLDKARKQREKAVGPKRKAFQIALERNTESFASGEPAQKVQEVLDGFQAKIATALDKRNSDAEGGALLLIEAEDEAKHGIEELRKSYRVVRPGGVALPPALRRDYEAHGFEWRKWEEEVIKPAEAQVTREASASFERMGTSIETRLRLELLFKERSDRVKRGAEVKSRQLRALIADKAKQAEVVVRDNLSRVNNEVAAIVKETAITDVAKLNDVDLLSWQSAIEERLSELAETNEELLGSLETQLQALNFVLDEQGQITSAAEEAEALEEDVLALRERAETDFELSQLGLAVEVVGHEFANSIQDVRNNLRTLEGWAKKNPSLNTLYQSLRTSFEHLDGYLTLFTPMNRRLYRSRSKITGAEIAKFLRGLLGEQLDDAEVTLRVTDAFLVKTLETYPSTFYPVFVNLVDNALFWVKNTPLPREILLDADEKAFLVSDSGPGVSRNDRDAIFEMRFSRKPGGRGLGLFISRQGLGKEGYTLRLAETGPLRGATFRVEPLGDADAPTRSETA